MLYEYVHNRNIGYRNTGKLVVAVRKDEIERLEQLHAKGREHGVEGLELLSKEKVEKMQPEIKAELGLFCPSSGIIDAADFVLSLEADLQRNNVIVSFNAEVENISKSNPGFTVQVKGDESYVIVTDTLINCAGLNAVDVAFTEAAVGAGISTLLMLATLSLTTDKERAKHQIKFIPLLIVLATGLLLIFGTLDMPFYGDPNAPTNLHVAPLYISCL